MVIREVYAFPQNSTPGQTIQLFVRRFNARAFNFSTIGSAILFALLAIAWFFAELINPPEQFLSFAPSFHISVENWLGHHPWLEVFNRADYGPYHGSIIEVTSPHPNHPPRVKTIGYD